MQVRRLRLATRLKKPEKWGQEKKEHKDLSGKEVAVGELLRRLMRLVRLKRLAGEMAEWFNAHAWKA